MLFVFILAGLYCPAASQLFPGLPPIPGLPNPSNLTGLPILSNLTGLPIISNLTGLPIVSNVTSILLDPSRIPTWLAIGNWNLGPTYVQPEQVHIAIYDNHTISVTWISFDDVLNATVQWGKLGGESRILYILICGSLDRETNGTITLFAADLVNRYVSRVYLDLSNDAPGDVFRYRAGSPYGWSPIFQFRYLTPRSDGGYEIAVFGDLGNANARSMGLIQKLAQDGNIDLIHHVGDYAYDLNSDLGSVGDQYFRQIECAAAYVPYMPTVGNHECAENFTHYINRFTAPSGQPLFYSYDLDKVHFISFTTEAYYYFVVYGLASAQTQYNWLVPVVLCLSHKANSNRKNVPWIVTIGHRPMYCSNKDCVNLESNVRIGIPITHLYALEDVFYQFGVDLCFWGHEHAYERMFPVYNRTIFNGTESPYVDPPAPVHITSGSAGCIEQTDSFAQNPEPWSAFRSTNYGFGLFRVYNETHARFRQVAAGTGQTEDEVWIVKSQHGPYGSNGLKMLKMFGKYVPVNHTEF